MYHHSVLRLLHFLVQFPLLPLLGSSVKVFLTAIEVHWAELEAQLVNREIVFAGMILEGACEEALWEEKPREPETARLTVLYPMLESK